MQYRLLKCKRIILSLICVENDTEMAMIEHVNRIDAGASELKIESKNISQQEFHRRFLEITFDICTYIRLECYTLQQLWKGERFAWAVRCLYTVMGENCKDVICTIMQYVVKGGGQDDAIEQHVRELATDLKHACFEDFCYHGTRRSELRHAHALMGQN
tara:strand:+ start:1450 stop:1926 length:477 start_codon:yes stop_codon:yes gene_type:complete